MRTLCNPNSIYTYIRCINTYCTRYNICANSLRCTHCAIQNRCRRILIRCITRISGLLMQRWSGVSVQTHLDACLLRILTTLLSFTASEGNSQWLWSGFSLSYSIWFIIWHEGTMTRKASTLRPIKYKHLQCGSYINSSYPIEEFLLQHTLP